MSKTKKKSVAKKEKLRDTEAMEAFGIRVRQLRIGKKQTIEEFANSIDLHASQLSRIERGETNVTITTIVFLAKAFGVKPAELL